ncbi:M48 family metallopeptidase [Streptomyces sp. NBC_01108]|uniref:hypothetical protein n=1 Tax=Streptomyces sp. NBC_01108 TaxID=2903751 RepID=UPI003872EDEB|nr:M48 family metallopeptidase [Streptomyces sp. NBC_01108]
MSPTLRALRTVALLTGFYLLGILLLAILCVVDWAAFRWTWTPIAVLVLARTFVPALPIVRSMFMPRTPDNNDVRGLRVDDTRQPRLWALVRDLADRVGTRAPDDIVLTDQVNASAVEDTRLLGLVAGRRRLLVGLPLMAGMSEAQLRFVLAYEMSRYANSETRLAAVITRGQDRTARAVTHFREQADKAVARERERQEKKAAKARAKGRKAKKIDPDHAGAPHRVLAALYQRYRSFSTRVTMSGTHRAEFAADAAAARIAGRDVSACALLEIQVLHDTHEDYMETYAMLGVKAGMLPPPGQVLGGLRHVLAARRDELDELRNSLPSEVDAPYADPWITERIARIEAMPDDGRASEPVEPALGLLVDTERTLAAVEEQVLTPEMLRLRRVDWPDLVHESISTYGKWSTRKFRTAVAGVTGGEGSVTDALDAIDAGAQWQIADRLHTSDKAREATGRVAREFARPGLRAGLRQLAEGEYVRQGRARWRLPWTDDDASLDLPRGHAELLPSALDAAVADAPDTKPLRALLTPDRRTPLRTGPEPSLAPRLLQSAAALCEYLWTKVRKKTNGRKKPPRTAESTPGPRDEEIRCAVRSGDWRAGAAFLYEAGRDWQERYRRAAVLQDEAVADDAWLLAWRAARPKDAGAALVHAGALIGVAAEVHGTNPTQQPTWEQSSVFRQVMARAREACHEAQAVAGDDPCPYIAEIPCALGLGYEQNECRALWAKIVVRDAPHLAAHDAVLRYWCYRWAGSYRQAEYLAREAARQSSPGRLLSLLPLYAAFKQERADRNTHADVYYKSPELIAAVDACLVDVAAAVAADLEDRRIVRARHLLAWTLYWQDRYEAALEQFRLINGPVDDSTPWSYFGNPKNFYVRCRDYSAMQVVGANGD